MRPAEHAYWVAQISSFGLAQQVPARPQAPSPPPQLSRWFVDNTGEVVHAYLGEFDGRPMLTGVRERGVVLGQPAGERPLQGCGKL